MNDAEHGTCPECHQPYDERDWCVHTDGCQLGIWEAEDQDFYAGEAEQQAMRARDREHYTEEMKR